jgi:hypothetical protein
MSTPVTSKSKFRPAAIIAYLAVLGRIVVAPLLLMAFVIKSKYATDGKVFIDVGESYFAFSQMDPVMTAGCAECNIGCYKTFMQLLTFKGSALMSKPAYEELYTFSMNYDESVLTAEMRALADAIEADPVANCMSGIDEWASPMTTIAGDPQFVIDAVRVLGISVLPQALNEAYAALKTRESCPTRWVLEAHIRLFKFQTVANSIAYASIPAADFNIFPEYTECRTFVPNDNSNSKLAFTTRGEDLVAVVPEILKLFPYSFNSSLKEVPRVVPATKTVYNAPTVMQALFRGYFGACRVCEVNTTGVYIEADCTVDPHWENYGLMLQSPDDIPVCSTTDVCVHNYYNSLWEFVALPDPTRYMRFSMAISVFRSRYADAVTLSALPGVVVVQILFMGMISLYQIMSQKRSVLLTQIWAYRCQNGRMQVIYLAQISYHLAHNSPLYLLGLTTGSLSLESIANLTLCFYAFSYSFINLMKARSGEQQLDRHFRLTWEIMQIFTTTAVGTLLYHNQETSLNFVMEQNGELLRKTTARGAKYCNLSDSCILFTVNLGVLMAIAAMTLGIVPFAISFWFRWRDKRRKRDAVAHKGDRYTVHDSGTLPAPVGSNKVVGEIDKEEQQETANDQADDSLTSFERHCLGTPFTTLFNDCDDFSHVVYHGRRASSVEAVLLTGFLFYGKNVYQAPAVLLLLVARLLPRSFLRTFNVLLIRWHLDPTTGTVSEPASCTWYTASAESYKLSSAVPIK